MTTLTLTAETINHLDLSLVQPVIESLLTADNLEQEIRFHIDFPREPGDPRELSEIPEVRLWFVRLDAHYPWLPYLLDWESELARYTAMLVPHQFSPTEGIQYNPEALEIFVMQKVFVLMNWMQSQGKPSRTKLKFMTKVLGYELDDTFFDLLGFLA
jgi:hypothetical protein